MSTTYANLIFENSQDKAVDEDDKNDNYELGITQRGFWTEEVVRQRRKSDWQLKKPFPSMEHLVEHNKTKNPHFPHAPSTAKQGTMENPQECFTDDVIQVWNTISEHIIFKLKHGFGVQIPGLCAISFQEEKCLKVDHYGNVNVKKTPVMILSRQIAHMYKVLNLDEYTKHSKADTVLLNLNFIAKNLRTSRALVEGAVTEVLQAIARAIISGMRVEFPFANIGALQIQNCLAKMSFTQEFCKKLGFDSPQPNRNPTDEVFLFYPIALVHAALLSANDSYDHFESANSKPNLTFSSNNCSNSREINCPFTPSNKRLDKVESITTTVQVGCPSRKIWSEDSEEEAESRLTDKRRPTDGEIIKQFCQPRHISRYPHDY